MPDEIICNFNANIDYCKISVTYDSKNKGYILHSETKEFKIGLKSFEKLLSVFEKIGDIKKINGKTYEIIIENRILSLKHLYSKKNKTHTLEILDEHGNLMKLSGQKLIENVIQLFKKFETEKNVEENLNDKKTIKEAQIIKNDEYNQNIKSNREIKDSKTTKNNDKILKSATKSVENLSSESVVYPIAGVIGIALTASIVDRFSKSDNKDWKIAIVIIGVILLIIIIYLLAKKEREADFNNNTSMKYKYPSPTFPTYGKYLYYY